MEKMEQALAYASRGWNVFPCHSIDDGHCTCVRSGKCRKGSPGKHPRTAHGRTDATTDPEQIRQWWAQWPSANVAIVTGQASGVVVIDLDGPGALETFGQWCEKHGVTVPPTRTCETPGHGGGWHLYFGTAESTKSCSGALGLVHVDVRGGGGYVVAPPSTHVEGSYKWVDPDVSVADLPDGLLPLVQGGSARTRTPRTRGATYPAGTRNNAICSLAGQLHHRGLSDAVVLVELERHNRDRCVPPLDVAEVARIAESVCSYPLGEPLAIGSTLSARIVKWIRSQKTQIGRAWSGKGPIAIGEDGRLGESTPEGYDLTLALALVNRGVLDRDELATAIALRGLTTGRTLTEECIRCVVVRALPAPGPRADIGFRVEKVSIIGADPSRFVLKVEGRGDLRIDDPGDLASPALFQRRYLAAFGQWITVPHGRGSIEVWGGIVADWLANAERFCEPEELTPRGYRHFVIRRTIDALVRSAGTTFEDFERTGAVIIGREKCVAAPRVFEAAEKLIRGLTLAHVYEALGKLGCSNKRAYLPTDDGERKERCRVWVIPQKWADDGTDGTEVSRT